MLILRTSATSPFGRKVRIAIEIAGLTDRVTVVPADHGNPGDSLRQQNPLGKVPTLVTDDGEALFDSRVIVEYLNDIAQHPALVPQGEARIAALRQQALADGILDASILQVYEARFRPAEHQAQNWLDYQQGKVIRSLAFAENHYATPRSSTPHIGEITLACALGFLDLRFKGEWRAGHPRLVAWLADFAARVPAYAATVVPV
jgi:glutathione S-transferase